MIKCRQNSRHHDKARPDSRSFKELTALASSGVARNDLLSSVAYPDSISGSDVVTYAYNRLCEQRIIMDQRGTIRTFYRDLLARITNDCVTTVGSNTDATVLQMMRGFDIRGMVNLITSTDSATQGAGTILNQVALAFNDFAQLITDQQSHSGAVTSGTPKVQYGFDSGASSSNEIRLNLLTYPNGRPIALNYGTSGGMNDYLNRIGAIVDTSSGSTTLAQYLYLGAGTPIRITYPQPGIWLDLWGGTSGVFAGIDQFGRIIDQRWQKNITTTPTDIDRYKYGYDRNSNRLWKWNVVGTAAVTSGLDELYAMDPLSRLTEMQRGVLNSTQTGIIGTPVAEQDWTLDPVGNWSNFTTKASGTTTLNQTRSTNTVNEITNITASTGPEWVIPEYDKAGNTITMPQIADPTQRLNGIFDAWNRLVILRTGTGGGGDSGSGSGSSSSGSGSSSSSGPGGVIARYQYDGRNFRIVKDTYAAGVLSENRHFFFTAGWQDIEERVGTSTSMDLQYVCGIRYIDELICRDDSTPQRLYACQDANFNLTSICDSSSGTVVERYVFDAYGLRTIMNAAWATITTSAYDRVVGHQGLLIDAESGLINNRMRGLLPHIGRFSSVDPIPYSESANLYQYLRGAPTARLDPVGLADITVIVDGHYKVTQPKSEVEAALLGTLNACDRDNPLCQQQAKEVADALWTAVAAKPHQLWGNYGNLTGGMQCLDWRDLMATAINKVLVAHRGQLCFTFKSVLAMRPTLLSKVNTYFIFKHAWIEVSGPGGSATIDPWPSGGFYVIDNSEAPNFPLISGVQNIGNRGVIPTAPVPVPTAPGRFNYTGFDIFSAPMSPAQDPGRCTCPVSPYIYGRSQPLETGEYQYGAGLSFHF